MESANQLAMKVASDDEDDAVDQLLEQQHQIMRSSSAYSLASNPESNGQQQVFVGFIRCLISLEKNENLLACSVVGSLDFSCVRLSCACWKILLASWVRKNPQKVFCLLDPLAYSLFRLCVQWRLKYV